MSKRDYQAIARAIHSIVGSDAPYDDPKSIKEGTLRCVASAIADVMKADNSAFDRSRFLEACETGTTKGMAR